MNKSLLWAACCGFGLCLATGIPIVAQEDESDGPGIVPVELFTCSYASGQGPNDLNRVVSRWNTWMDETEAAPYSAWTLTPFYFGEEQDFDLIWLGVAPNGEALGRGHDQWIADGGKLQADFDKVAPCGAHVNMAAMNLKPPMERDDASSSVLSFSDCELSDEATFDEAIGALQAWAQYRGNHGSNAGMWILFPAFGGGGAEFDFKFVASHPNHESMGVDYDQYGREGYMKAGELFQGVMDCDDARVYMAELRRDGISDAE